MDSVLTSNVVDHGFEPQSDQAKDFKIGICCFSAIFTSQGLRSTPLLSTLGRLSRNFGSSLFIFLFDAAVGGCVQSKCI